VVIALDKGPLAEEAYGVLVLRPRRLLGPLAYVLAPLLVVLAALALGRGSLVYLPHPPGTGSRLADALAMSMLSLASRLGLARLWVNIHDPLMVQVRHRAGGPGGRLPLGARLLALLEPALLRGAAHATAASKATALYYEPLAGKRVGVYYAGSSKHLLPPPPRGRRGPCRVGYVGSPYDDHLDLALDAVEAARVEAKLVVMTSIRGGSLDSLRPSKALEVVWGVKYADFPRAAELVDVFILPRRPTPLSQMTLPNKYPMYLSSRRPVVASETLESKRYLALVGRLCGPPRSLYLGSGAEELARALERACRAPSADGGLAECLAVRLSWEANLERAMREAGIRVPAS